MKIKKTFLLLLFATTLPLLSLASQNKVIPQDIDWKKYLSQHDMYWTRITSDYYAGAIMGNGFLGSSFYKKQANVYRLDVGRVDVTEGRGSMPDEAYAKTGNLFDDARLPIGHFKLSTVGTVSSEKMRLSLYDAINEGTITTNKGAINFQSYVHAEKNYILFETTSEDEEVNFNWEFEPLEAISPRVKNKGERPASYINNPNPEVEIKKEGNYNLSIQELYSGNTYVVAWQEVKEDKKRRIIITISHENSKAEAIAVAKQTIDECLATSSDQLKDTHTAWWNNYYPASFITFPNSKMESFYWAQIYKFACASRQDKLMVDLQGPWAHDDTPWPALWMNLNIQLTYSWMYTANRSELSEPLWKALNENLENLKNNVHNPAWREDAIVLGRSCTYDLKSPLTLSLMGGKQYEVGNLTWILFYYWQYCIYNNKQDELVNSFYPLLKKSIAYYSHIRYVADGKYNLPVTGSPEYSADTNCNYDLSLLRWGLSTLLEMNDKYKLNDQQESHWSDFLNNLVDYPVDPNYGYKIGKSVNLTDSHRHYSHLLMIYPLYTVNWENPEDRALITKSVDHWMSMPKELQGYSFTGSSSMYASMGDGTRAVAQLQSLINNYIQPNTLYKESGPVIETPFAAVASLHDLYLQSWNGKIRIFHAVPSTWKDASFINLRTEGAFLVSASRKNGKTVFIQLESEAGGKCNLQTGMDLSTLKVQTLAGQDVNFRTIDSSNGLISIDTNAGDVFHIISSNDQVVYPSPIEHPEDERMPFGVNDGSGIMVKSLTLPENVVLSAEKSTTRLVPFIQPDDAGNKKVFWQSSDKNVVTVSSDGLLTAVSKGKATITVTSEDSGVQATCSVTVIDEYTFISSCLADAYVYDGKSDNARDTNYGEEERITVKKDGEGYNREGFLKFSIADLDNVDINTHTFKAIISLYLLNTGATVSDANWQLSPVDDTNWKENEITWNNKPAIGTEVINQVTGFNKTGGSVYQPHNCVDFDITEYALAEYKKGNKIISVHLSQDKIASGGGGVTGFASKEEMDALKHPKLSILAYIGSGLNLNTSEFSGQVYPTITDGIVYVELTEAQPIRVNNLYGISLQNIPSGKVGKQYIDLSAYDSGVYIITVGANSHRIIKK